MSMAAYITTKFGLLMIAFHGFTLYDRLIRHTNHLIVAIETSVRPPRSYSTIHDGMSRWACRTRHTST
ncbi:MAG: hypothetical protein WBN68_00095, partial [Sedimenticolaceae bacterium]